MLLIAPREQRAPLLELGVQGGALHRRYKIYLDYVAVARVPEDYEEPLTEMSQRNIQRDRDDVKHLAHNIPRDLKILKERYEKKLRWQLGNPEREDLTLRLWTEMIEEARDGTASGFKP